MTSSTMSSNELLLTHSSTYTISDVNNPAPKAIYREHDDDDDVDSEMVYFSTSNDEENMMLDKMAHQASQASTHRKNSGEILSTLSPSPSPTQNKGALIISGGTPIISGALISDGLSGGGYYSDQGYDQGYYSQGYLSGVDGGNILKIYSDSDSLGYHHMNYNKNKNIKDDDEDSIMSSDSNKENYSKSLINIIKMDTINENEPTKEVEVEAEVEIDTDDSKEDDSKEVEVEAEVEIDTDIRTRGGKGGFGKYLFSFGGKVTYKKPSQRAMYSDDDDDDDASTTCRNNGNNGGNGNGRNGGIGDGKDVMRIRNNNTCILSWFLWGTKISRKMTDEAINKYFKIESENQGAHLVAGDTCRENGIIFNITTFETAMGSFTARTAPLLLKVPINFDNIEYDYDADEYDNSARWEVNEMNEAQWAPTLNGQNPYNYTVKELRKICKEQ